MVFGCHITASLFLFSQFIEPLYKNIYILLGQSVSHTEISSLPNSHLNGSVTLDGPCILVRGKWTSVLCKKCENYWFQC